jgi:hypothetical protein
VGEHAARASVMQGKGELLHQWAAAVSGAIPGTTT